MELRPEEYELIVEQAPLLIWRADATGLCDYFNRVWLSFTGRSLAEELGDGWASGVHPEDVPRCLAIYREAFAAGAAFEMEYRLRRHDGEFRWIFDRGVPVYAESGAFLGYVGSCVDVHARVVAELERQERDAAEIATLRSLLPICSDCKRVRGTDRGWQTLEQYVREHRPVEFTHSLCSDCLPRWFPPSAGAGRGGGAA